MEIALGRIWIGANDKYGEDIIIYLGNDGATIPDDSSLLPLGEPRHKVANSFRLSKVAKGRPCITCLDFVSRQFQRLSMDFPRLAN